MPDRRSLAASCFHASICSTNYGDTLSGGMPPGRSRRLMRCRTGGRLQIRAPSAEHLDLPYVRSSQSLTRHQNNQTTSSLCPFQREHQTPSSSLALPYRNVHTLSGAMKSILRRQRDSPVENMEESKAPTSATESAGSHDGDTTNPTEPETLARTKTDEEDEYITGFKLVAVMGSVTLVVFLLLLDMTIVATAIPHITTQFHSLVSKFVPEKDFCAGALFHRLVRPMHFSEILQWKCGLESPPAHAMTDTS